MPTWNLPADPERAAGAADRAKPLALLALQLPMHRPASRVFSWCRSHAFFFRWPKCNRYGSYRTGGCRICEDRPCPRAAACSGRASKSHSLQPTTSAYTARLGKVRRARAHRLAGVHGHTLPALRGSMAVRPGAHCKADEVRNMDSLAMRLQDQAAMIRSRLWTCTSRGRTGTRRSAPRWGPTKTVTSLSPKHTARERAPTRAWRTHPRSPSSGLSTSWGEGCAFWVHVARIC